MGIYATGTNSEGYGVYHELARSDYPCKPQSENMAASTLANGLRANKDLTV